MSIDGPTFDAIEGEYLLSNMISRQKEPEYTIVTEIEQQPSSSTVVSTEQTTQPETETSEMVTSLEGTTSSPETYKATDSYQTTFAMEPFAAPLVSVNLTLVAQEREKCFSYCNNHSTSCFELDNETLCSSCMHNTQGRQCHICNPGYYRDKTKDISDPGACQKVPIITGLLTRFNLQQLISKN